MVDNERKLDLRKKHLRALNLSMYCRTESMGRVVFGCKSCGCRHEMYKSCKHRWCSQCGVVETYRWGEGLGNRLLNLAHSHMTFTLPQRLRLLAKICEPIVYDCMFVAVNEVLQSWFKSKHGLKCGVVMVLHTSGSDLKYHPHIHSIVSCGGVGRDDKSGEQVLMSLGTGYLCSHQHLGNQFRIRFSKALRERCESGKLPNQYGEVMQMGELNTYLQFTGRKSWIVGVEKGLWNVSQVVGYVGRYTKRACMSEYKISDISGGKISFTFNDYANTPKGEKPVLSTKTQEMTPFLDSLLQHVPDKGFHVVRYCGVYANAAKQCLPDSFFAPKHTEKEEIEGGELSESSEVEQFRRYRNIQKKLYGTDPFECKCGKTMKFSHFYIGKHRIFGKVKINSS